jgi:hypothetical protein
VNSEENERKPKKSMCKDKEEGNTTALVQTAFSTVTKQQFSKLRNKTFYVRSGVFFRIN